jgi:hypothetical protein
MVTEGTWIGKRPSETEIVELFASKSMWHSHFKKFFSKVPQYPLMQKWLKGEEDAPEDFEIWGEEKTSYNFKDLSTWLEEKAKKGKGKAEKERRGKNKEGREGKGKGRDDKEKKEDDNGGTEEKGKKKKKKDENSSKKHNTRSSGGK